MWVCTHCRTRVVHLACYISCGYLDDKSVSLSYWLEEQNLTQDLVITSFARKIIFASKVTLISHVARTNFKLAATLDIGMQLGLVV